MLIAFSREITLLAPEERQVRTGRSDGAGRTKTPRCYKHTAPLEPSKRYVPKKLTVFVLQKCGQ